MANVFYQNRSDRTSVLCFNSKLPLDVSAKAVHQTGSSEHQGVWVSTFNHGSRFREVIDLNWHLLDTSGGHRQLTSFITSTCKYSSICGEESRVLGSSRSCYNVDKLFMRIWIFLKNYFLRSVLVHLSVWNAEGSVSTLAPRIYISVFSYSQSVAPTAWNINYLATLKLFNQDRRVFAYNCDVSDTQLPWSIAPHCVNKVVRSNEGWMGFSTRDQLYGNAIQAKPRLGLVKAFMSNSSFQNFLRIVNNAKTQLASLIAPPTKDLCVRIISCYLNFLIFLLRTSSLLSNIAHFKISFKQYSSLSTSTASPLLRWSSLVWAL